MKNLKLDKICKLFVFISYLITTIGLPIYFSIPLIKELWNELTIINFLGWCGYGILFMFYCLFILTIFGYAVMDD
jgi:hypothetical protein